MIAADETTCGAQVSSPTCFESRGGAPKPVIVKISSKEPADVIPPIGFNACYKDTVGSNYKCLAFSIIQSCADSSQLAMGSPIATPGTGGGLLAPGTRLSWRHRRVSQSNDRGGSFQNCLALYIIRAVAPAGTHPGLFCRTACLIAWQQA